MAHAAEFLSARAASPGPRSSASIWYGFWLLAAIAGRASDRQSGQSAASCETALPGGAADRVSVLAGGAAADGRHRRRRSNLRKLQAYPIPVSQLFAIEVMLRVTAGIEMVLVLLRDRGWASLLNPELPKWSALAVVPYMVFNLFLAVGLRDLLMRLLARKRIREVAFFLLVMCAALPQLLLIARARRARASRCAFSRRFLDRLAVERDGEPVPEASTVLDSSAILLPGPWRPRFSGAGNSTGRWSFDAEAAAASDTRPAARAGLLERFYRLPSALFRRSAGRAGGKRNPVSGALAALPAGVPDGIHVRPGGAGCRCRSAARNAADVSRHATI